jgi:hypothetical protein
MSEYSGFILVNRNTFGPSFFVECRSMTEQTTQWPKGKVQKDQQRSTKHTYKTKDKLALRLPQCNKNNNDNN